MKSFLKNEKYLRIAALAVLALIAMGLGLGAHKIRELNTRYSMTQFMPKNHPLYASDRVVKKTFGINEREPVIVNLVLDDAQSGTWLEPARVALLERATETLAGVAHIEKVLSLANVEMAASTTKGIQVDRVLSLATPAKWASRVLGDPLLSPGLIAKDGRKVSLLADIPTLSEAEMNEMLSQTRARIDALLVGQGAHQMVSGMLPIQSEMTVLLSRELLHFLGLAFAVCLVTLLLYFRSLSTVLVCLVLVAIANIATFTALAILQIPFSVLSTALPVMCSIEALAIGSHTLFLFGDEFRQAQAQLNPPGKAELAWRTYRSLIFPNFLMSTTTIIGFATLISSQVPLIRQFSQSVCCGIFLSCVSMQLALPSLMILFPVPVARSWTGARARWTLWAIRNRRGVVYGTLALLLACLFGGFHLNWAVQLFDDLPRVGDIKSSADLIDSELGGMIPLEVMISRGGEENPWYEPARIATLEGLLTQWRQNSDVGSAVGLPDLLNTGITKLDSRRAVAESIFLYGFSGAENPVRNYLSSDGNATRLTFRMKDVKADEMENVVRRIQDDVQAAFPGFEVKLGGMAVLAHPLNAQLSSDLIYGLWQSLFLISVLLVLVFGSFRLAFIAAVPNLLAPVALLVTMALLKTPIKPVVAIIFSIALGLAYNNTVFLLTRLKKIQTNFRSAKDVITRTWYREGNPCLFSSLSVIGGFAIFLASYFSLNRTFGAYMLWSVTIGILGDLMVLPALLRMFPWFILPLEETPRARVIPRHALVLAAFLGAFGPSAAAAAENVVQTPFVMTMQKDTFAELVFNGAVAKATGGEIKSTMPDISANDPFELHVSGINLDVKYNFVAPENARAPSEWLLQSTGITAELNVANITAHRTETVQQGDNSFIVTLDGACTNVKLALKPGSATATGKLDLDQRGGAPRLLLNDFQAQWAPGSWQVISMNCTGPRGFDQAVANAARQQLGSVNPFLDQIKASIQQQLDLSLGNVAGEEILAGNPLQVGQTLRLNQFHSKLDARGNTVVSGMAYFYFKATHSGCGAAVPAFASAPAVKPGETALFLPFKAVEALLACAVADGSFSFRSDTSKFAGFQELEHNWLEKNAVWPDLNSFGEDTLFKLFGAASEPPVIESPQESGTHAFQARIQQKTNITMYAPQNGQYVPYVNGVATYSGLAHVTVTGSKISIKPDAHAKLDLRGDFDSSYAARYHPNGSIDWAKITPPAQQALLQQGWSMKLPAYGVNPKVMMQPTNGDLQGPNFRLGIAVTHLD